VDLEDLHASVLGGEGELDLAVETAGPHEGGVEDVGPVGGADDLDVVIGGESEWKWSYPSRWFSS
jgi:hypothetical protein